MRRMGLVLVLLAVLSGTALGAQGRKGAFELNGKDGTFAFKPVARDDGKPCLSYDTPSEGGRTCFIAVGPQGGWALEAWTSASTHDAVVYGATIGAAARVRIGKVATLRTGRYSKRLKVRFYAGLVPRKALRVRPSRIVALDRHGRLLGRQHYNDGHGHFGRCDGRWDRKHYCPDQH
jgi:hypothetical protein